MNRQTLDKLRGLGFEFPESYDIVADLITTSRQKEGENARIVAIEFLEDPKKNSNKIFRSDEEVNDIIQYFIVKVSISTEYYTNNITVELDGRTFLAYRKSDIFRQKEFTADVLIDFSNILRVAEDFTLKAKLVDAMGKVTHEKSISVNVKRGGKVEENIEKELSCFCERDIELREFENILIQLRKSETGISNNKPKLFMGENCNLNESDKKIENVLNQLNATLLNYNISKCIHKIHFLAQIYHETAGLTTALEIATNKVYKPFYGRGALQLTDVTSYKIYTAFYNKDSGKDEDFLKNYSIIAENLYHVFNSAGWYWKQGKFLNVGNIWVPNSSAIPEVKKVNPSFPKKTIKYKYKNEKEQSYGTIDFNLIADKDQVDVISFLVNGGKNGLFERRKYVIELKRIFEYEKCANK